MFQLFDNKQSCMLEYLQGWGWDVKGTHMWWFVFLRILGNPLNKRQPSMMGQFFLYLVPRGGHGFNIKPSGLISYRSDASADKNRSSDSGNSYRRTHMFLSVWEKPLHPINTAWLCNWNTTSSFSPVLKMSLQETKVTKGLFCYRENKHLEKGCVKRERSKTNLSLVQFGCGSLWFLLDFFFILQEKGGSLTSSHSKALS